MATLDRVNSDLLAQGIESEPEQRLGNGSGWKLKLRNRRTVVSVWDNGTCYVQGQDEVVVREELAALVGPAAGRGHVGIGDSTTDHALGAAWSRRTLRAHSISTPKVGAVPVPLVIEISLLGTFAVRIGGKALGALSVGSQRLLVFLALHDRVVGRIAMAGTMWPEASDHRAGVSLRSALSRLDAPTREAVLVASAGLRLAETVAVDLRDSQALAQRLLEPGALPREADLSPAAVSALSLELLPDWYDDWVVAEAEDWRHLRMNALEAQARLLTAKGRLAGAAGAARAAMRVEPLRESAHASLIRVHLAEGNQSEALRVFDRYRTLLLSELGLEPTRLLSELVVSIRKR